MFAERIAEEKKDLDLNLRRYAFQQADREATETFGNAKTQAIQRVGLDYRDPGAIPKALSDVYNAGMALATRGGKDQIAAYQASGYAHEADQVIESAIGGHLADNDIRGAERDLQAYSANLSSGAVHDALQNRIRAAGDRLDALNRDASRDRIQDQLAAAKAGLPGWEKIASPGDYQTVHKNDWQRQYAATQKWAAAGAAEKHFDQMSAADVADIANGRGKPTAAYPGVSQDLEINQAMQAAAVRSLTKWKNDPADAIIQNGRWQQIDWSKPKDAMNELAMRANTAPGIAQERGQPVQLQSKQEAAQLAGALGSMPPREQVSFLKQLHDNSGNGERGYFSVLRQIYPTNPTAAIAGQRVSRPDEWDAPGWYDPAYGAKDDQAQAILAGNRLLHPQKGTDGTEGKGFPMPNREGTGVTSLRGYFAQRAKDLFDDRGELGDAHLTAYYAAYAGYAAQGGNMSGKFDPKIGAKAFEAAVGATTQVNGHNVVAPNGMNPAAMDEIVHKSVAAAAQSMGAPADWNERMKGYRLVEDGPVGSGRYRLSSGNGYIPRPDGKKDADGRPIPFMIDLTR